MNDIEPGKFYWVLLNPTIKKPEPDWQVGRARRELACGFLGYRWVFDFTDCTDAWLDDVADYHICTGRPGTLA